MCGIIGLVGTPATAGGLDQLVRLTDLIAYRGPDDHGFAVGCPDPEAFAATGHFAARFQSPVPVLLGHRRLSIIDLSAAGHQPMTNEDGTLWITYNGEVYNFQSLKQELLAKGHRFTSNTDTETILHLYEEEGPDCVRRLSGMFAFGLWDARKGLLLLARDPFGVKPLYYTQRNGTLSFASEMKALLSLDARPPDIDMEAFHQFMTFLWVPDPKTIVRGVKKLPAGHYAVFRNGVLQTTQYWDLEFPPEGEVVGGDAQGLAKDVRELLRQSVEAQLMSDVPLGAFLSSGLDSSSIVAMMAQASPKPVNTYTISFPSKYRLGEVTLDDPAAARRFAQRVGADHTDIIVEPEVVSLLPKLVWHLDEPIADPAAITAYLLCQEARKRTTVLLSGVGGDELFAGYRKYAAHGMARAYQRIPSPLRRAVLEPVARAAPSFRGTPLKGYVRLAKKMVKSGSLPPVDQYLMNGTYLDDRQKDSLYSSDIRQATRGFDPWATHRDHFARVAHADFLNQMLYVDLKTFMVSLNLTYTDKMSMASSVEVRVPFLDKSLAKFAAQRVPPSLKLHNGTTKYILREAMAGMLPREVLTARKAGFGAPVDYWLARDLRPMVDELLSEDVIRARGYFNAHAVTRMMHEHRQGRQDWSMQIWQLLTWELWLRTFVDAGRASAPK